MTDVFFVYLELMFAERNTFMPIKMIVTDLDGTLLRSDKTVSSYTESVFRRCHDVGIKIVFATARPVRAVNDLCLKIEKDAAVYHNGAVFEIENSVCGSIGIEQEVAKALLLKANRQFSDITISVEINDVLYSNFEVSGIWPGYSAVITDFTDLPDKQVDKIIFCTAEKGAVNEINKMLDDELYSEITENQILLVMNKNARKFTAIGKIAERFNISVSDVAAFGDDFNDVEMIRGCGTGVAVLNAIEEVKAAADYICDSNDNDGAAKWLEENVLDKKT